MKISVPVILRENGRKSEYDVLLKNFIAQYNQDKKNGDQLKEPHLQLMHECIYYGQIRLNIDNRELRKDFCLNTRNIGEPLRINLSAYLEANKNIRSVDTFKRRIKRLKEAGFISSKQEDFDKHGISKTRRSDVLINPEFLLIYDQANPDYQPYTSFFSEADLLALTKMKSANCPTVSGKGLPQEQSNRIMDVDTVDEKGVTNHRDDSPMLPEQNQLPDTTTKQSDRIQESKQKSEKNAQNPTPETVHTAAPQPGEQSSARPAEENAQNTDSLAEMQLSYARTFYIYLIQMLFSKHEIYHGETQKAIEYLVQTYFSGIESEHQARYRLKVYKTRVDMAASYIKRNNFDFSNIYPCAYLDVKNKKGFAATRDWYDQRLSYKAAQAKQKREFAKQLEEKKVMEQLQKQYSDMPTLAEVNRSMAFLAAHMPHKKTEYVQFVHNQQ
ncbi:hypothetical protein KDU71_02425 [Carboxylicivirga sediminis]|uniref:Uncharacterized protein n=1 Tax=Carboxylicivirga sediminis TaxID=2006564 RepID=A0A941F276_9BACT|nr:hypothetical protein [Carboxylicivirga sediminis]MBR8534400.1 hypothetical protein [Carboxylicivirga sediminis]